MDGGRRPSHRLPTWLVTFRASSLGIWIDPGTRPP